MRAKLKERVERFLCKEEGEASKQEYLNTMSSSVGKRHHQSTSHHDSQGVGSQDETSDNMDGSDLSQGMIGEEDEQKFILSQKNW